MNGDFGNLRFIKVIPLQRQCRAHIRFEGLCISFGHTLIMAQSPIILPQSHSSRVRCDDCTARPRCSLEKIVGLRGEPDIAAAGNYVEIHVGGKVHLMREPLAKLIAQLDAGEFIRVHRSHVVKLTAIAELQPMFQHHGANATGVS